MTEDIFNRILLSINLIMINFKKILLLTDNAPSHKSCKLENVEIPMLPPNATSKVQPLDSGIIQNFKKLYR